MDEKITFELSKKELLDNAKSQIKADIFEYEDLEEIVMNIKSEFDDKVKKALDNYIGKELPKKLDKFIMDETQKFYDKEITTYDNYGDVIRKDFKISTLIKEKFDGFITEKVDSRGESDDRYNKNMTRIEYLVDKRIEEHGKKMCGEIIKDTEEKIKNTITEELKDGFTQGVLNNMSLDKLLAPAQKK